MLKLHLQTNRYLLQLVKVRYGFIALHLLAILIAQYWFSYELPYLTLKVIVAVELAINMLLFYCYRGNRNAHPLEYLPQILIDIIFLTLLLSFSGGATNPFVSLLLLPVAIAAVTLPRGLLLVVTLAALSAYSALLWRLSPHQMHMMDMQQHFIGMWINFVLSALMVVLIVASLSRAMRRQERFFSQLREEQLRQEQLVSLGTAAAQFAHQLATPLGTANLLIEELQDEACDTKDVYLTQLKEQISLCSKRLQDFRVMAEEVKQNRKREISLVKLATQLKQEIQLNFAAAKVTYKLKETENLAIVADTTLLPALLNLIQNAVQASNAEHNPSIMIGSQVIDKQLTITIRDFGKGLSPQSLLELGSTLVKSETGLGIGVMLSHATLERLGAQLKLYNHQDGGAVAEITMDLAELS
ncbi:HAMP domain-containing sensor histidine kinase [Paraglaciecola sp.]|uniref:sensor histidine kinase n=1 Tax=Paraglaciecola sp. TaxID=1920173 RepID=UPI0030F3F995